MKKDVNVVKNKNIKKRKKSDDNEDIHDKDDNNVDGY